MNDMLSLAYSYVDRGWSVIPVHAGARVPIERDWPARLARTRGEVDAMLARWSGCNIGIATGVSSGIWVLDIDPGSGGDAKLAALVAAYGRLPETYTVRTPSGGVHYYFRLPDDFEPRNVQHGQSGRLPIGIDVRGWHGQVVAPPSTRPDGAYQLLTDFEVARAPDWLLDLIRPIQREPRAAPEWSGPTWSPGVGDERVRAVLAVAVPGELEQLANAAPGTRNETAFEVACRLLEFVNAGWIGHDDAYGQYVNAGAAADVDGTFTEAERAGVWASARRRVGAKAATLDDTTYYGSLVPFTAFVGDVADFSPAATAAPSPVPGFIDPDGAIPAQRSPESGAAAAPETSVSDPMEAARERAIVAEMSRLWVRREAEKRLADLGLRRRDWSAELLTEERLAEIAPPTWLVEGWLATDSLARINGPSGHGKSFLAVELACCVATGTAWHGHAVREGLVVLVAAEGASGVRQRVEAWKGRNGVERVERLLVLPSPVQVTAGEWASLVAHLAGLRPALVILDTQARVSVGLDENSATEMGEFVDGLEALRVATGACVNVVHHRGLKGSEGRGSSAVKGAMTTEMDVTRSGTTVTIACRKQKDAPEPETKTAQLSASAESAVLVVAGDAGTVGVDGLPPFVDPSSTRDVGRLRALALVEAMRDEFGQGNGGTRAEIRAAYLAHREIVGLGPEAKRKAFNRAWGRLEEAGRIARNPMAAMRFRFAEVEGLDDLAENPDNMTDFGWPIAKKSD